MKETLVVIFIILQLLFFNHFVHSVINLFIARTEMDRTLGLDVQLNFIENGIVNLYSVKFPYRINTNITYVQFSWNTKVLDRPVHYTIRAISHDNVVIPLIQIPSSGKVPLKTETFKIEYRCIGIKTGKFDIQVNFKFDWPSSMNQTKVSLKQEKLCVAQELRRTYSSFVLAEFFQRSSSMDPLGIFNYGNVGNYDELESEMDSARKDVVLMSAENIFYSLIGFVGAVVLVIAFLIFVYYRSIRKSASSTVEPLQLWIPKSRTTMEKISADLSGTYSLMSRNVAKVAGYADLIDPCSSSYAFRSSIVPMIVYEKPQVINMKKALNELYADRNFFQILSIEKLEGTFGEMKWAIWKRNMEGTIGNVDYEEDNVCFEKRVIVKTLKVTADQRYLRKFLEEALAFFHVEPHENLAQVTAVTSYDCLNNLEQKMIDFPLVCYSHNGFGNLKKFLISCRNGQTNAQSKNPKITYHKNR
ncbi:hypothetical protein X798_04999 [Onchocerca flexuosa]|uniref:WIF domain-containing protein n=1 Tax=Onchocerca flexuosa TaxID=387005 RepID=A0A238BRT7_9BILA|nr:hypothetical protein X798_04999 [Onchocerca flexuosa]